jgi:hypothetical protein
VKGITVSELTAVQTEFVTKVLNGLKKDEVVQLVKDLSAGIVSQFHQELVGENEDALDRHLRKYRATVARRTTKVAQNWCKWSENGPILMPDRTRLYYRRGDTEVMLLEFPPQTRFMRFRAGLLRGSTEEKVEEGADLTKSHNFSLALPYIVFLFKFNKGTFVESYMTFNDRPLKTLQEKPLRPYLSNLDNTLKMCHGASFDTKELQQDNLAQQVAYVLTLFWQTVYSDEWSSNYWTTKKHFVDVQDSRLKDLASWQAASEENPLFVIEDANWIKHGEDNFGDMIVKMFESDADTKRIHDELYNDLSDNFVNEVKKTINDNVESVKKKIEETPVDTIANMLFEHLAKLEVTR